MHLPPLWGGFPEVMRYSAGYFRGQKDAASFAEKSIHPRSERIGGVFVSDILLTGKVA